MTEKEIDIVMAHIIKVTDKKVLQPFTGGFSKDRKKIIAFRKNMYPYVRKKIEKNQDHSFVKYIDFKNYIENLFDNDIDSTINYGKANLVIIDNVGLESFKPTTSIKALESLILNAGDRYIVVNIFNNFVEYSKLLFDLGFEKEH